MSWLITPLHLVFHMRQADFRHIYQYLVDVEGFSLKPESYDDVPAIVNWIVVKLERLGWSKWQISKELLEWIHLKSSTRPEWLLAVARSDVFASDGSDVPLAMAVRHWIKHHLGSIFDKELFGGDRGASIRAYKELFKIGQFGLEDKDWIEAELVERMALGRVGVVVFFVRHFGGLFGIKVGSDDTTLIVRAMHEAAKNGKYGVAVALARCCDRRPDQEWLEKVQLLQLPTSID
jgi:hypothetical protein